jgi:hypothetical protein
MLRVLEVPIMALKIPQQGLEGREDCRKIGSEKA